MNQLTSTKQNAKDASPTSTVPAHSVLSIDPNPVSITPGQKGSVTVNIDPSDNQVTAVQLEIGYDPNFITNVKVVPGILFTNPVVLIDKNTVKEGRYTYAFGIMPNHAAIAVKGHAATITFNVIGNKVGESSQLALLPSSLVTARGISESVLKSATGTIVRIGN